MKFSTAEMILIALCGFRSPVTNPSFAMHQASEIAGAAHSGSVSDLAPSSTARLFSSRAASPKRGNKSSLTGFAELDEITDSLGYLSLDFGRKLLNPREMHQHVSFVEE